MDDLKMALAMMMKAFCKGQKNIITAKELGRRVEKDGETVRKAISVLRKEGVPICSTRFGFYYASDNDDIHKTIAHLESRAHDMLTSVEGMKKAIKNT